MKIPAPPFEQFLSFDELTEYAQALAAAAPRYCTLSSLGPSREGRAIPLLTVTDHAAGEPEDKPAYLVHGVIHAAELAGTHVVLDTAYRLITDAAHASLLDGVTFYLVPRLNPDGAEHAVQLSRPIRSRWQQLPKVANTLYPEDLNGDGRIMTMLKADDGGDHCFDPVDPRLLRRRYHDSVGPFYRFYIEGLIHQWDGTDNISLQARGYDWNRNWSYNWQPEPAQRGAGDFPFSEVEMRHLAAFVHDRPNLFALLDYHTGAASFLMPPSSGRPDALAPADWQTIQEIGALAERITGLPAVPVISLRAEGRPDLNLHGHSEDFAYHHRGIHGFGVELGTMLDTVGIDMAALREASEEEREMHWRQVLAWWDAQEPSSRQPLFRDWESFDHPQLGPVLLGGFDQSLQQNQAPPALRELSAKTAAFTAAHAGWAPRVTVEALGVERIDATVHRIRCRVVNRGRLATSVTQRGASLRCVRPVRVEIYPGAGVELLSQHGHTEIGHLDGVNGMRALEWFVRCPHRQGTVDLQVFGGAGGNCRLSVEL